MGQPWERLVGEGPQRFEAFAAYRDMGADRSLAKVAQQLGKSTTLIERWSAQDTWVARVDAWDIEQDRIWRQQQVNSRREVGKRHLRIAGAMQGKLVAALAAIDPAKLSARDLAYWLEVSVKVQRQAIGQGDRVEVTGEDGGPIELANLTPEQQKARLAELAAEIRRRTEMDPTATPLGTDPIGLTP